MTDRDEAIDKWMQDFLDTALQPLLGRMADADREHVCDERCGAFVAVPECSAHGLLGMASDTRSAQELTLAHLKSHHPRRARYAIAKLTEELNPWSV